MRISNKKSRIQFRETYDSLITEEEKSAYIKNLGEDFNTILKEGYLYQDNRDGQLYDCMFIGNTRWLAQNFQFKTKELSSNNRYNWEGFVNACPEGWRLPSNEDYRKLLVKAAAMAEVEVWEEKYAYKVGKLLKRSNELDFNSGFPFYGLHHSVVEFWTKEKEWFYLRAGQNETYIGFSNYKIDLATKECFVRYVQDVVVDKEQY
ncbi:MAG: FISUMP domain-containing protein [Chitinophagales bacterium]